MQVNNLNAPSIKNLQAQVTGRVAQEGSSTNSLFTANNVVTEGILNGTCTDGVDDGNLSFWDGCKSFFKGAVKSITSAFSSPANILKTVAVGIGCAALVAVTGGAATPFLIAGGAVLGAAQAGKGIYDATQATTDAEAKAALENVGAGTTTLVASCVAGAKYTNATGNALIGKGSLATYKNAATTSAANIKTNFGNLTNSVKTTATNAKTTLSNTAKDLKNIINEKPSAPKTTTETVQVDILNADGSVATSYTDTITSTEVTPKFTQLTTKASNVGNYLSTSVKNLSTSQIAKAQQFISTAKTNMSYSNMVAGLEQMGIGKAAAMELISQSTSEAA